MCQELVGLDAYTLFMSATMQNTTTGLYLKRREETGFKLEKSHPVSDEWL